VSAKIRLTRILLNHFTCIALPFQITGTVARSDLTPSMPDRGQGGNIACNNKLQWYKNGWH
jgi:hypothetical protein